MSILYFFADLFGYVLNFLYELTSNYGVAIILFSILVKVVMIPLSIKQQKTMKASTKIQEEMKQIQFKYKNDPEKMNQEVMSLYKRENMSPFSGCLSSIVQLILLLSVFLLVRSPLTYMVKIDSEVISNLEAIVEEESETTSNYKEIQIIQYARNYQSQASVSEEQEISETNSEEETENNDENNENETNLENNNDENEEEENEEEENEESSEFNINDYIEQISLNMDFLGIDLSAVPTQDITNWKTLVIPILYVISSFISIKMSTSMQNGKKKKEKLITDGSEESNQEENNPMLEANKSMSWFMPLMSISIAIIAPLGLALYWLMNNILSIAERLVLNKFLKEKEEAKEDAQ